MFAIIKTGGKQYIVRPGDKIKIEKLKAAEGGYRSAPSEGKEVVFSDVLLVSDQPAGGILIGTPYVAGYKVRAKVLGQGRGKKVIVYKYKPKKRYHKKQGHRQAYTEVEILNISKGVSKTKSAPAKTIKKTLKKPLAKTAVKPKKKSVAVKNTKKETK